MRFVYVSGRIPKGLTRRCAFCLEPIGEKGYVRELDTHILYCDFQHLAAHQILTEKYMEAISVHKALVKT